MSSSLPSESALPETLITYDQWLCWRTKERDGKKTKIPIDPNTGSFASTTDSETWASFERARERAVSDGLDGLGFVFTDDDPIVGVDLDDCRVPETETTLDWADEIIDRLDSFTEVSPSGTGYHVLVKGYLPEGRNRKGDIELYETARFFTVTGEHVDGTPTEIRSRTDELETVYREYLEPDDESDSTGGEADSESAPSSLDDRELLERAKNAANGDKFERLWRGNSTGYDSQSEADMALCSLLAFWTGGDAHQMDRLFRDSGLIREKWDEQHFADGSTYGEKTIERAIAGTSEFYDPGGDSKRSNGGPDQAVEIETAELRTRETARLERIEELEQRLNAVLAEKAELEEELEAERERRRELEAELEEKDERRSLFSWR